MTDFTYLNPSAPNDYKCRRCGATGIKLWREYQTFKPRLLCAVCLSIEKETSIEGMNDEGKIPWGGGYIDMMTDAIGGYVPAIPDEEGLGYWGYTSVPQEGILWWEHLPTWSEHLPNKRG